MKYVFIKDNKVIKLTEKVTAKDLNKYLPDLVSKGNKIHTIEINSDIITVEYCDLSGLNKYFIITNISNNYTGNIMHTLYGKTYNSLDEINNEIVSCY